MVQWLRLHSLSPESLVSIPGQRTRSHVPQIRPKTLHSQIKKNQRLGAFIPLQIPYLKQQCYQWKNYLLILFMPGLKS